MQTGKVVRDFTSGWQFSKLHNTTLFFQNIGPVLLPTSTLVLEEGSMAPDVLAFVADKAVAPEWIIRPGTWWPPSRMHWLPATTEIFDGLTRLSMHCAEPEICDHLYAVCDGYLILVWHDAFFDPLRISAEIPADRITEFGQAVGISPVLWQVD